MGTRVVLSAIALAASAAMALLACGTEGNAPDSPRATPTSSPTPPTASATPMPAPSPSPTPAPTPFPSVTPAPTTIPSPMSNTPITRATVHPTPRTARAEPTGPTPPDVLGLVGAGQIPAPAPQGLDGWINSPPLTVDNFRGKVVLFDFWTYTCVNCVRTLAYLREWHRKYADQGLLIIGVHTPEFEFEKLTENVQAATEELSIEYPVAQDNDYVTWNIYRVQAWPTKYIMDGSGFVRYYHRGEGSYADTERVIRFLLEEAGRDLSNIEANSDPDPQWMAGSRATDPEEFITRELYGGTRRNIDFGGAYIANEEYYEEAGVVREYTDPQERKNHFIFLRGHWLNEPENLRYARATNEYEDYLGIKFFANEVNAVLSAEPGVGYSFRVTMDGKPVPAESAGADIAFDENGDSVVMVDSARMYRLVSQKEISAHELLLMPKDENFSLYSFTFGAYPLEDE